jgi:SAM-dependent methyltransferase
MATRTLFGAAALAGPSVHATVCSAYFGYKYRAPDPWGYETREYEQRKYSRTLELIGQRDSARVLEVGCGEGVFTHALAQDGQAGEILAIDISRRALRRARARCSPFAHVRIERWDAFRKLPPGEFDLIVCAEILYYAGGRIPALARGLASALARGGRIVLVHPWPESDLLHAPFRGQPEVVARSELVEHDPVRPYALALFERA